MADYGDATIGENSAAYSDQELNRMQPLEALTRFCKRRPREYTV